MLVCNLKGVKAGVLRGKTAKEFAFKTGKVRIVMGYNTQNHQNHQ
jgi:hypothetical protein